MNGELEVRRFEIQDDGQVLNVLLEIHNNSNRALHIYREARAVQYDEASRILRLQLTDRYIPDDMPRFMTMQPTLLAIDPGESETLTLRVARIITQLGPEQPGRPGPTLRENHVYNAEAVEAEISWSDKPFYREPGDKRGHAEQIRRWERGVLETHVDRRTGQVTSPRREGPPSQQR